MDELDGLETFIVEKLLAHIQLQEIVLGRVYVDVAPEDTEFPFVLVSMNAEVDRNAIGYEGRRIFVRPDYLIKGVSNSDSNEEAAFIAGAIDNAISGANNDDVVTPEIRVRGAFRTSIVKYPEVIKGRRYNHRGGIFRFFAHQPRR